MWLQELVGKELINIANGKKLAKIKEADIILDGATGEIESLLLQNKSLNKDCNYLIIPYDNIKQIGRLTVIVDINE